MASHDANFLPLQILGCSLNWIVFYSAFSAQNMKFQLQGRTLRCASISPPSRAAAISHQLLASNVEMEFSHDHPVLNLMDFDPNIFW
jgi:hypothetical protein